MYSLRALTTRLERSVPVIDASRSRSLASSSGIDTPKRLLRDNGC